MPTKISKVAKDLNVGVNTAVEFLRKHNVEVEDNPNARIDDAAVEMLIKEYSKDKDFKEQLNKYTTTRKEEKKTAKAVKGKPEEVKTKIPETKGPKVVGKVDLDSKGNVVAQKQAEKPVVKEVKEVKAEVKESKPEVKPAPKQEAAPQVKPAAPVVVEPKPVVSAPKVEENKEQPKEVNKEKKEDEVFRPTPVVQGPQLKVLGSIDLSAINQSTRPKKKSKEERRRERIDKSKATNAANAQSAGASSANPDKKKRKRIGKEKVDIEKTANQPGFGADQKQGGKPKNAGQNNNANNQPKNDKKNRNKQRPIKVEIKEEDVQKQVKETLARLTNKQTKKSVKKSAKKCTIVNWSKQNAQQQKAKSSRLQNSLRQMTWQILWRCLSTTSLLHV